MITLLTDQSMILAGYSCEVSVNFSIFEVWALTALLKILIHLLHRWKTTYKNARCQAEEL